MVRRVTALGLALAAGCHLVGGLDAYVIDPALDVQTAGAGGITGATVASSASSPAASTSAMGSGGGENKCVESECPMPPSAECAYPVCKMNKCATAVDVAGKTCNEMGGKVCDGAGHCVECINPTQCKSPEQCDTVNHKCDAVKCANMVQDPGNQETDVDCGGPNCKACATGKKCQQHDDCTTGKCNNVCVCAQHSDCKPGEYCEAGSCKAKKGLAAGCMQNYECKSGNCVWCLVAYCCGF